MSSSDTTDDRIYFFFEPMVAAWHIPAREKRCGWVLHGAGSE